MLDAAHIRPSASGTWVICRGNIAMRAMFPQSPDESDSEVCEDGTACHWLAAEVWEGRFPAEGTLAPNGRVLTDEMFDAVDLYHDTIRSWPAHLVPVIEKPVPLDVIYPGMSGTPDAWVYDSATHTLYIADLKFGFRFVEVYNNWQLTCYAIGLIALLNLEHRPTSPLRVRFTIVQPRNYHRDGFVRTFTSCGADIMLNKLPILQNAINKAVFYVPNPGCLDCPGRHACKALQASAYTAMEYASMGDPYILDNDALGAELSRLKDAEKRIKARVSGLEAQAQLELEKGATVPGWVMGATQSRETWTPGSHDQVLAMGKLLGVNVTKPPQPITPAQARKAGMATNIVASFAHRPSTGMRLMKHDPLEAIKAFGEKE